MSNLNPEYDKYQNLRDLLQRDVNSTVHKPISAEIFAKDANERGILKHAKKEYALLKKNPGLFKQTKDQIIEVLVKSKAPSWNGLQIKI